MTDCYSLKRYRAIGLILSFWGCFWQAPVQASSYDYYVKAGEHGDGSEADPFGSIADAVEAIGDKKGKKIYVAAGTYGALIRVPRNTTIVGAGTNEVTITGDVILSDNTSIEKLGFTGTGDVLVAKHAEVVLEKLRFKNINKTAIKTEEGGVVAVIHDVVIDNAGKGMYLQAGTRVEIDEVEVVNGREEGIDIRENVTGFIKRSSFRNNQESGIEIVLGSADMSIVDSSFSGNKASGIAAQFFEGAKKLGNVRIEGNMLSKNNWGVDCKAPKGNLDSRFYYLNSLTVERNTYKENRSGDIAPACKILTDEERLAFEQEEAERKALTEQQAEALMLNETALTDRLAKSIEFRKSNLERLTQREASQLQSVWQVLDGFTQTGEQEVQSLVRERSTWRCYFLGGARSEDKLSTAGSALEHVITRLETEKLALQHAANQKISEEKIAQLKQLREKIQLAQHSPTCSFSLLGWVMSLFEGDTHQTLFGVAPEDLSLLKTGTEDKLLFLGTLGYYPKVREVAVVDGDERLVTGLMEGGTSYRMMIGDLHLPLGGAEDPVPPLGASSEYSFPVRFANIYSGANIRSMHLSNAAQIVVNPKSYEATLANLAYADIHTLGKIQSAMPGQEAGETNLTTWLGRKPLHWVDYRENSGSLSALRETITPFQEKNESTVVVVAWDEKQGKTISSERQELLRDIVQAGASLVIGTGLIIPFEQTVIDTVPVYASLGSAWANYQAGDTSKKSAALEMNISAEGKLEVNEKNLVFTAEKGLEILP